MAATGENMLFIGGEWSRPSSGEYFDAFNPADNSVLGKIPLGSVVDVDRAVDAAQRVVPQLRQSHVDQRSRWCEAVARLIEDNVEPLASVLSEEQGKVIGEARGEVLTAAQGFRNASGHIKHLVGDVHYSDDVRRRVTSQRVPRGVYAIVTPWNFPINIPTEYLAPALATGNSVVWVPAPSTSLTAIRFMEVIAQADLPPGTINLITGPGPIVGNAAVAHAGVNGVGFTGSSETGLKIARSAAGKPLLLELGGNGPTIVLADADLEKAASAISEGAFLNAGQTCAATELVLVERDVHDRLAELVAMQASKVRVGDPASEAQPSMGPINNVATIDKISSHVQDAVDKGASVYADGRRIARDLFFGPTVLGNVAPSSDLVAEETFGPVIPLVPFDTYDEMLTIATRPQFGLASSVWTRSISRAFDIAEELKTGLVNINEASTYWEIHIPFGGGGGTLSGVGRLGGIQTLIEMTEIKTITFNIDSFS